MSVSPILAVSFFMNLVSVVFIIGGAALILIILIQKGKGGGLSAAFGGGLASGILGSKTGDFLTWLTIGLAGMFLMLAVVMAKYYKPGISNFGADQPQQTQQLPAQQSQQLPIQQTPIEQPSAQQETPAAPAENSSPSTDANSLDG